MGFLLRWTVKLGCFALIAFAVTGNLRLPQTVLGVEVPADARQWAERNAQAGDVVDKTEAAFKQAWDNFR